MLCYRHAIRLLQSWTLDRDRLQRTPMIEDTRPRLFDLHKDTAARSYCRPLTWRHAGRQRGRDHCFALQPALVLSPPVAQPSVVHMCAARQKRHPVMQGGRVGGALKRSGGNRWGGLQASLQPLGLHQNGLVTDTLKVLSTATPAGARQARCNTVRARLAHLVERGQ